MVFRSIAFMIIIFALSVTGVLAQDIGIWDDACHGVPVDKLSSVIDSVDYVAMCRAYTDCLYAGDVQPTSCEASVYGQFSAQCAEDDIACLANAQFYTGFINAFAEVDYYGYSLGVPEEKLDDMLTMAEVYEAGDFDTAFELLAMWQADSEYIAYAREAMQGAMLERSGAVDRALGVYDASIKRFELIPLMYWIRGDFHRRQGNRELAAADYLMLDYISGNDVILGEMVQALAQAHPLEGRSENWQKYPDQSSSYGVAGDFDSDRSYDEATSGTLTFFNDDKHVILRNLSELITPNRAPYIDREESLVILEQVEADFYRFDVEGTEFGSTGIRLRFSDSGATMFEEASFFEGYITLDSWLKPEGAPDPRADIAYLCEGAARSRLAVGDTVESSLWSGTILYFESPQQFSPDDIYNSDQTTTASPVKIIGGHQCGFGSVWWQVLTAEGETGWTPEAANVVYQVDVLELPHRDNAP